MLTKEILEKEYIENQKSLLQIGQEYDISNVTVKNYCKKFDIPIRSHRENQKLQSSKKIDKPSKQLVEKLYLQDKKSIGKIRAELQISHSRLMELFEEYNIEKRTQSESVVLTRNKTVITKEQLEDLHYKQNISKGDIARKLGCKLSTVNYWFDYHNLVPQTQKQLLRKKLATDIPDESILKELYIDKKYTANKIAGIFNVSNTLVLNWLVHHKIEKRPGNGVSSQAERDLYEFCCSLGDFNWQHSDRSLINPYELDIISYDLKLAIEYCGIYWHSEFNGGKDKNYHATKQKMCEEKGFLLLTVFETDDIEKIKTLIRHIVKQNKKIGARKLQIKKIENKIANNFHNNYHRHNTSGTTINLGLYKDSELLGVGSFTKARFSKKYQWEIARITYGEYGIIGGTSKLIRHFVNNYDCESLVSYCDLRFGNGNSYKNTMTLVEDTPPNYWYFSKRDPYKLYSRVKFQKHKLEQLLEHYDPSLTEFDNMVCNDYDRIWDCGNRKFEIRKE